MQPNLATDGEVTEFLRRVSETDEEHMSERFLVAADEPDFEHAFALLALAARCTCETAEITACPNYLDGDEELDAAGMVGT